VATVQDLLDQIHDQGWSLLTDVSPGDAARVEGFRRGWVRLAYHASRVTEIVGAPQGVADLLESVIDASRLSGGRSEKGLVGMGLAMGGLADLLVARSGELDSAGIASRGRLQASVLAGLHAAARATMQVAVWGEHPDTVDVMKKIAAITETAAMIPPDHLRSQLDFLALPPPGPTTVDGAVQQWRQQAATTLSSPWLVTEHALRRVAGDISQLCRAGVRVLDNAAVVGTVDPAHMGDARALLSLAAASWQQSAVWPEHLRLGGRSTELRRDSAALVAAVQGPMLTGLAPAAQVAVIAAALRSAQVVAAYHERATARLADRGGLWVSAAAMSPEYMGRHPEVSAQGWLPKPAGSKFGGEIAAASASAVQSLNCGVAEVADVPVRRGFPGVEMPWETVPSPGRTPPSVPQSHRAESPGRGIAL
jgi:hypothetical protein